MCQNLFVFHDLIIGFQGCVVYPGYDGVSPGYVAVEKIFVVRQPQLACGRDNQPRRILVWTLNASMLQCFNASYTSYSESMPRARNPNAQAVRTTVASQIPIAGGLSLWTHRCQSLSRSISIAPAAHSARGLPHCLHYRYTLPSEALFVPPGWAV